MTRICSNRQNTLDLLPVSNNQEKRSIVYESIVACLSGKKGVTPIQSFFFSFSNSSRRPISTTTAPRRHQQLYKPSIYEFGSRYRQHELNCCTKFSFQERIQNKEKAKLPIHLDGAVKHWIFV